MQFTFKPEDSRKTYDTEYKTNIGGFASLFCYIILLICFISKSRELLAGHHEANHMMTNTLLDKEEPIDLYDLGYMFALSQIDPKLGRIVMT